MTKLFQYNQKIPNQMTGVISKMTSGLNEYLPSNVINDDLMSDLLDVKPYKDDCVEFKAPDRIAMNNLETYSEQDIRILACIHSEETNTVIPLSADYLPIEVYYVLIYSPTGSKIIAYYSTLPKSTKYTTAFALTESESPPTDYTTICASSTVFKTEAETFYVFSRSYEKRIHFARRNVSGVTYGYADVPAYPKKIISHANRIFFIDTENKLWWSRAGDLFSWYSMEYDADAISVSANCANVAHTIAAQPSTTRPITATVTKVGSALDTLGILTIVGTNALDQPQTAVLPLAQGRVQTAQNFKTVTSATQSGWASADTADTITIGVAPVGLGIVTSDAGYWTLERELSLHDFCVLSDTMYIFTTHNIYSFTGYSPDTFALNNLISDIGIDTMVYSEGTRKLTTGHNVAYFIFDGFVYQFNGNEQPQIMSRPVTINNQSSNGIMGGVSFSGEKWVIDSTTEELIVYDHTGISLYYYIFNYETKSWWKRSGIIKENIEENGNTYASAANSFGLRYVPSANRQEWKTFFFIDYDPPISYHTSGFALIQQQGCLQGSTEYLYVDKVISSGVKLPFITTKAFNTNPSETGSLTEVVLSLKGTQGKLANITLQYSLSVDGDDFVDIKRFEGYIFNGDIEIFSVPVPISNIANAHHYRLKLIIASLSIDYPVVYPYDTVLYPVYLYKMERKFRLKGRSR